MSADELKKKQEMRKTAKPADPPARAISPVEPVKQPPTKPVEAPVKPAEPPTKPVEAPVKAARPEVPVKPVEAPVKPVEAPVKAASRPPRPQPEPASPRARPKGKASHLVAACCQYLERNGYKEPGIFRESASGELGCFSL